MLGGGYASAPTSAEDLANDPRSPSEGQKILSSAAFFALGYLPKLLPKAGLAVEEELFFAAARGRLTGARTLAATEWEAAESAYDVIRTTNDVATIARNTGIRSSWVARAKDHLFFRKHQLDAGVARFDADPFIANAWGRLQAGTHTANDLALLRHELFEARFEGIFRTNYQTAHGAALRAGRTWEWTP